MRARKKLGEILVEGGLLTRKQLEEALPFQKKSNLKLGQFLVREGASDIHVSPEKESVQVRFRVDGRLHEVPAPPKSMFLPIISRLKILASMDIAISRIPQDGRFTVKMKNKDINIRASSPALSTYLIRRA